MNMKKIFNILSPDIYLISPDLEYGLTTSKLNNIDFSSKNPKGVYVVKFRKLKSNNTIFYNYIYYNELFTDSLLFYFRIRYYANNLLLEDIKNCLIFVDNNLCDKCEPYKFLKGIELTEDYVRDPLNFIGNNGTLVDVFYHIFKLSYKGSSEDIISLIKYDIEFKYFDIVERIFKTNPTINIILKGVNKDVIIDFNSKVPFNHSFLNNSLIVCNDLDEMLNKFKDDSLKINAGSQSKRGEVNSLNYFLSHFDIDYRNSLYHHHRYHRQKIPQSSNVTIPKSQFSFKNVHMNLGTTRFYSNSKSNIIKPVSKD